jgi:hypothetical protein
MIESDERVSLGERTAAALDRAQDDTRYTPSSPPHASA